MSDGNLLVFGCVVTFIGLAGAYVYIRESFTTGTERPREAEERSLEDGRRELSEVG